MRIFIEGVDTLAFAGADDNAELAIPAVFTCDSGVRLTELSSSLKHVVNYRACPMPSVLMPT